MATPQSAILPEAGPHGLFLVLHLRSDDAALTAVERAGAGLPELLAEIGTIDPDARLAGTLAFGAGLWLRLTGSLPQRLRPFEPVGAGALQAPATGGDLLLHLHSGRPDLNYLAAKRFLGPLSEYVEAAEETHGFRYLDCRDLTGFIDGTENPEGEERGEVAVIGEEDPDYAGGSYLLAQRFVHRLSEWERLAQPEQEAVIGRSKPDSVELDEAVRPASAHISRVVIEEDGEELEIVRHGLPYGDASGEAGLFFLAYCRDLTVFEKMLARMFGTADGEHDRLMEFSRPVTGAYFFAPSLERLKALA